MITNTKTKKIRIGSLAIGGGEPIRIQSMTNTKTYDVEATVSQIQRLEEAGCEIVRASVPDMESAVALTEIKKQIQIPLSRTSILITGWPSRRWNTALIRSASIRAISETLTACGRSSKRVAPGESPYASASTQALWKKTCWRSTEVPRRRRWRKVQSGGCTFWRRPILIQSSYP